MEVESICEEYMDKMEDASDIYKKTHDIGKTYALYESLLSELDHYTEKITNELGESVAKERLKDIYSLISDVLVEMSRLHFYSYQETQDLSYFDKGNKLCDRAKSYGNSEAYVLMGIWILDFLNERGFVKENIDLISYDVYSKALYEFDQAARMRNIRGAILAIQLCHDYHCSFEIGSDYKLTFSVDGALPYFFVIYEAYSAGEVDYTKVVKKVALLEANVYFECRDAYRNIEHTIESYFSYNPKVNE